MQVLLGHNAVISSSKLIRVPWHDLIKCCLPSLIDDSHNLITDHKEVRNAKEFGVVYKSAKFWIY